MRTPDSLEELIEALRCLPGVGPKSATRMAYHLLQRDHPGAKRLSRGARGIAGAHPPLRALQHVHRGGGLRAVHVAPARRVAAVRGGVPRRPPHDGADAELWRPLLRAHGAPVAARRHRPARDPPRPAPEARDRRRGEGGDPRHQLHGGGGGDGPLRRRRCSRARASRCRASPAAFRSAARSSTSTRARWPRRSSSAARPSLPAAAAPAGRAVRRAPGGGGRSGRTSPRTTPRRRGTRRARPGRSRGS